MLREAVNLVLNLGVELRDATLSDLPIHTRTLLAWEEKYARCHTFLASTLQVFEDSWAFAPADIMYLSFRLWPAEERFPILRDSLWHCYIVVRPRAILLGLHHEYKLKWHNTYPSSLVRCWHLRCWYAKLALMWWRSFGMTCPVIEKYKLPPIQIFDKNCPLKRVNQKFAIFRKNVCKLELVW